MCWWKAHICQAHKLIQLGEALNFGGALDLSQQFSLPSAPPFVLWCSTELSPPLLPPSPSALCFLPLVLSQSSPVPFFTLKRLYAFTLLRVAVGTSLRLRYVFSHCETGTAGLAQLVRKSSRPEGWGCPLGWLCIWVTQDESRLRQRAAALPVTCRVVALQNCLAK